MFPLFGKPYRHCDGINPSATTLTDPNGRPQFLLERGEPIRELL